ncbi:hypothetical protein DBY21_08105 [Candidatus Gastranaerophilales bacterium]|nr:MAG: hypothetical protein DBY21_08105 [Candidatus Gastranaerophilales bacterium]
MQVSLDNQTSFNGKLSPKTLFKFKQSLNSTEFQQVKNFRAGKRYTNIDIVTINNEPVRLPSGAVVIPKETFAEFANSRAKNGLKSRIKLADGILPYDMRTFKLITHELIKRGESLLDMFK